MELQSIFTDIYKKNFWGSDESRSGPGSTIEETAPIRAALEALMVELGIKSLLDLPCGDHNWMSQVNLHGVKYLGLDICQDVIDENNIRWANLNREFKWGDITKEIPQMDLVLVRDCLVHLPIDQIFTALNLIKESKSKWLLTTSFTGNITNVDICAGDWRPLALTLPPFNFPEPVKIIDETHFHKKLMLWSVNDIPNCKF